MAIEFISTSTEYVSASLAGPADLPIRVTVPFKADVGAEGALFAWANSASTTEYLVIWLLSGGTIRCFGRVVASDFTVDTTNTFNDGGVNVVTIQFDYGGAGGDERLRIKLNDGDVVSFEKDQNNGTNVSVLNTLSFGRLLDSSPDSELDGIIEQPCLWFSTDDFEDHDSVYNNGTILDPSTLALGEDARWPFNAEAGSVTATDTEIDDAIGSRDLDTVNGDPTYVTNFLVSGVDSSSSSSLNSSSSSSISSASSSSSSNLSSSSSSLNSSSSSVSSSSSNAAVATTSPVMMQLILPTVSATNEVDSSSSSLNSSSSSSISSASSSSSSVSSASSSESSSESSSSSSSLNSSSSSESSEPPGENASGSVIGENYSRLIITNQSQQISEFLTVPPTATHARLRSDTNDIRYTADESNPPRTGVGMILKAGRKPKEFLIEDVKNMRFRRAGQFDAGLNIDFVR